MAGGELARCAGFSRSGSLILPGEVVGPCFPGQAQTGPLHPQELAQPRPLQGEVES